MTSESAYTVQKDKQSNCLSNQLQKWYDLVNNARKLAKILSSFIVAQLVERLPPTPEFSVLILSLANFIFKQL